MVFLLIVNMKAGEIDPADSIMDTDGLNKAYSADNKVYVEGDTLFIAGTTSFGDLVDDGTIPLGMTNRTKRYEQASKALSKSPQVKRVVGHSLGGSVALTIAQKHDLVSRTYGAPVVSLRGGERYRAMGDPISALDFGATTSVVMGYPHGYQNIANKNHKPSSDVGKHSFDKNGVVNMYQ
jgi:hypothetical protein